MVVRIRRRQRFAAGRRPFRCRYRALAGTGFQSAETHNVRKHLHPDLSAQSAQMLNRHLSPFFSVLVCPDKVDRKSPTRPRTTSSPGTGPSPATQEQQLGLCPAQLLRHHVPAQNGFKSNACSSYTAQPGPLVARLRVWVPHVRWLDCICYNVGYSAALAWLGIGQLAFCPPRTLRPRLAR